MQLFNAIRQTHYRCRWGEPPPPPPPPPPAGLNVLLSSVAAAAAAGIQLQSSVMFNLGISLGIFQWQWRRQEETQTDTGCTESIGLDWMDWGNTGSTRGSSAQRVEFHSAGFDCWQALVVPYYLFYGNGWHSAVFDCSLSVRLNWSQLQMLRKMNEPMQRNRNRKSLHRAVMVNKEQSKTRALAAQH